MRQILCVAVVMSALSGPALAGMSEGVAAVTVGDYQKAIAEFQPLAASGDPAAQYQLAKIYLEGHGPADGLPQGIDLMTKAANGNHPEAQAQLGLMYAMGLGVQVDNVQAYDWLSKAMAALPEGTRRTVAEANRDAVLKRMNASQQAAIAGSSAKPAEPAAPAKPAQEAASKPAATTAKPAATTDHHDDQDRDRGGGDQQAGSHGVQGRHHARTRPRPRPSPRPPKPRRRPPRSRPRSRRRSQAPSLPPLPPPIRRPSRPACASSWSRCRAKRRRGMPGSRSPASIPPSSPA